MKLYWQAACCVTALCLVGPAAAQDNHYWSNQFGSRSALMGGAVVGGVRDTSAGCYNPGALGFIDNPSLSVSGNAYQYQTIEIRNGIGFAEDLKSDRIQAVPTLLSGIMKFENAPDHTLGYSVISKTNFAAKFTGRIEGFGDIIPEDRSPGEEEFIGQVSDDTDTREIWFGGSYAYKISENISVGGSVFIPVRNQNGNSTYVARTISSDSDVTSVTGLTSTDYYNIRALGKFGAAADFSPLRVGLTFTTPSLDITGDGEVSRDLTATNIAAEGTDPFSFVANDRQDGLDAEYESPLSVALGADFTIEESGTTIAFAVEYFDSTDAYGVISPEDRPFLRPSDAETGFSSADFLRVYSSADEVVNFSIGVEQEITKNTKGYLSFRSDMSSREDNVEQAGIDPTIASYDLYHVTAGGAYRTERSEIAFGLMYSFGTDDNYSQQVDFDTATEDNLLSREADTTKIDYIAITYIVVST